MCEPCLPLHERKCPLLTCVQVGLFVQTVRKWDRVVRVMVPQERLEIDCLKLHQQW